VVAALYGGFQLSQESDVTITLKADFSVFGLLYVFAQAIERVLEPLSRAWTGLSPVGTDTSNAAQLRADKEVAFWAVATALAALACGYFNLKVLEIIGQISGNRSSWFDFFDIAVTALAIGAGTKPLHDLIDLIQKPKQPGETTTTTAAG
jgi:hypothetical protein